ncbi:hypothetical protein HQ520_09890 [bacterium]|nr:hypothetical protein [bacterium]
MAKTRRKSKTHQVEIAFSDEKVTSFGGMILAHRLAEHLGLWSKLAKRRTAGCTSSTIAAATQTVKSSWPSSENRTFWPVVPLLRPGCVCS